MGSEQSSELPEVISREAAKARGLKYCSCATRLALVLVLLVLVLVLVLALMLFAAY